MEFEEVGWTGVDCINLAQQKMHWQTAVNKIMYSVAYNSN
jgi:hypothetical protein